MNTAYQKSILVVEDEAILAMVTKKMLERFGYTVFTSSTGEKAVEAFKQKPEIDLVLMDIDLGSGMDGTEAAEIILSCRDIPVVFLSSHTEPEIVEKTEKITSYGYVVKNTGSTVLDASIKMAFKLFRANREIAEREIRMQAMLANISDVVSIIGSDGKIKYVSQNVRSLFGWQPEELIGAEFNETIHLDDVEDISKVLKNILQTEGASMAMECRYKCKMNKYCTIDITASNHTDDPTIKGILLNYHDVTLREEALENLRVHQVELELQNSELRQAQAEIETARSRYFDLYDLAPVGYLTVNALGQIIEANLTLATMLKVERSVLVKDSILNYIHQADRDCYYLASKHLFETGQQKTIELRMQRNDESILRVSLAGTIAQDSSGAVVCHIAVSNIKDV